MNTDNLKKGMGSLALMAALVGPAAASYELLLASDEANNVIHRFDAISGRSLGEFGRGRTLSPVGIAADSTKGVAYVASFGTNSIQTFDYSTGELKSEFKIGASSGPRGLTRLVNGNLAVATITGIIEFTTAGSLVRSIGTGPYSGVTQAADGGIWGYNYVDAKFRRFTGTGVETASFTPATSTSSYPYFSLLPNGSSGVLTVRPTSLYGWTTNNGVGAGDITTGLTTLTAITLGHGPMTYVMGDTGSPASRAIIPVNSLTGLKGTPFGMGTLGFGAGITSVIAPEPGTWLVIGLGLAALRTRRRR